MEPLSEELVEETWKEVAEFSIDEGSQEMIKLSRSQPQLMAFSVELTSKLKDEVKELAIYLYFVVYRMFEKGYGDRINDISSDEIIDCYEANKMLMKSLESAHDKFYERVARIQMSAQPHVMRYITEALFEEPDDDDPVHLSEKDAGYLFLIMKTIADVLNNRLND